MKHRTEEVILLLVFLPILYARLSLLTTVYRTGWDYVYTLPLLLVGGGIVLLAGWLVTVLGGFAWMGLLQWSGRLLVIGIVSSYVVSGYFFFRQTSKPSLQ